jgi:hypothetical protein
MARRYSFFVIFLAILIPLSWWSNRIETSGEQISARSVLNAFQEPPNLQIRGEHPAEDDQRRELMEVLDRLVAYEHYYRSVYGHFTKLVSRLGYSVPAELSEVYDIRVSEASRDRLILSAQSEINGRQQQDMVTVDQSYEVHSSFVPPVPRPEYLKGLALKQLRVLRDAPIGQAHEELGVFTGYFHYEQLKDSQNRKVVTAVGLKPPVLGVQLELGSGEPEISEVTRGNMPEILGQKPSSNTMSTLEEAYLAQRIFHAEVGRYAKNWSELARIASFRFEDKARFGEAGQVPFGDAEFVLELDAAQSVQVVNDTGQMVKLDKNSRNTLRVPSSSRDLRPLEIEAISPEQN